MLMKTAILKPGFTLIFIFSLSLFTLHSSLSQAQVPTVQDCLGAILICQDVYVEVNSYSGNGNYHNEIYEDLPCTSACPGSCLAGEVNSVWYTLTVQSSGLLRFTIDPVNNTDDYDWAVYDLTELGCADIYSSYALMQKSCNAYGSNPNGNTGISTENGGTSDCNNCGATKIWNADLPVDAGRTYVLVVENWSGTTNGFTLDFSASTAGITDIIPPALDTVYTDVLSCGISEITIGFSEKVMCESVDEDDFSFTGPDGPFGILDVQGNACLNGGASEKQYTLLLDRPFVADGEYALCLLPESNVYDPCENISAGDTIAFYLDFDAPVVIDSAIIITGASSGENNGHITGLIVNGNEPLSYLWHDHYQNIVGTELELHNVFTGNYYLHVTDTNSCETQAGPYFVDIVEALPEDREINSGALSVFPNPNWGKFTVRSKHDIFRIAIYDITGNVLYSFEKADIIANTLSLDLGSKSPGIYLVKATLESGVVVSRFVQVF